MRKLSEVESERLESLVSRSIEVTLLQPTETGLSKSIMDATASVRLFLGEKGLHDYSVQRQGPEHKAVREAVLVTEHLEVPSKASLYRPRTKKGDPRIWFRGLPRLAEPDDILAVFELEGRLIVINLTRVDVVRVLEEQVPGPALDYLQATADKSSEVARELLDRLREIARQGPVQSVMAGPADTAIGRTLESALGIAINSRREPDYKGIEIKASRRARRPGAENRKNLFAQVANWEISRMKSSREILDAFGYWRDDSFKLYCTVSTRTSNSQGLRFNLEDSGFLHEVSEGSPAGQVATWALADLHRRLHEKHSETFWVGGTVKLINGREHFEYTHVVHTRRPIVSQFDLLLEQGEITMDHLIKRNPAGDVKEKGPLFKISPSGLRLLFPPSKKYDLR